MTGDIYSICSAQLGANATADDTFYCFSRQLQLQTASLNPGISEPTLNVLLLYAAAMVFLMQAGFAMVVGGAVQRKNVANSMLKNLLDAAAASLSFFAVGYAFAFGGMNETDPSKTFVGHTNFFLMDVDDYAFWIFQYTFSAASATIVAGTLAERCQMGAYMAYSLFLVGFVYPVVAHAVWSYQGFLSAISIDPLFEVGMIDFAGSAVVHLTGGFTALLATIVLGPRQGRFYSEDGVPLETPKEFPGHSIVLQMLGTFILWYGWFGFNGGSALLYSASDPGSVVSLSGINTSLSGGAAGVVALLSHLIYLERTTGERIFSLKHAMNGSLSGLVAITGGAGVTESWCALIIGGVAGVIYVISSHGLERLRLDDAVDAIPVHMVNGIWGVLAVGLFASPRLLEAVYGHSKHPGWFYSLTSDGSDGTLFGTQCIGLLFVLGWVFFFMYPFFVFLNWKGWLRADPLDEIVGLDISYHGGLNPLTLLSNAEQASAEQISAFEKLRDERRRRFSDNSVTPSVKSSVDA